MPPIAGETPWAVVLCPFQDVPPFQGDASLFTMLFNQTGAGMGGLYDYWRDMSQSGITLEGTDVFDTYLMQYSFAKDWMQPRGTWIGEAMRLLTNDGIDVSSYFGIVAVVNATVDSSSTVVNGKPGLVVTTSASMDQSGWRWCKRCQGLWYGDGGSLGVCPNPEPTTLVPGHTLDTSTANYIVLHDLNGFAGQSGWSWCKQCQGLWYEGGAGPGGVCPQSGRQHANDSLAYQVVLNRPDFPNTGGSDAEAGLGGQAGWRWCKACQGLWYGGNVNNPANPRDPGLGSCPATKAGHVLDLNADGSVAGDYRLLFVYSQVGNVQYTAHEMGHGYGLDHANLLTLTTLDQPALFPGAAEYADHWCVMGSGGTYQGRVFGASGSGLIATNRYKLGWLRSDQVWSLDASALSDPLAGVSLTLAAVDHPEVPGSYLMARIVRPERTLTVEFRKRGQGPEADPPWDSGLANDAVLVHELRTWFDFGEKNWKWCRNCQALTYVNPWTPGRCPGTGGDHDHTGSGAYSLVHDVSIPRDSIAHDDWFRCNRCQCLFWGGAMTPGRCPAGDQHDQTDSPNFALVRNPADYDFSQHGWQLCANCNALYYSLGPDPGNCAAGGKHVTTWHDDFTLMHTANFLHTWLIPDGDREDWQPGAELAHDAANVRIHIDAFYLDSPSAQVTIALLRNEEPGWWRCRKCMGLLYHPIPGDTTLLRRCPDGGVHEPVTHWNYTLTCDTPSASGQVGWRICRNCFGLVYGDNPDWGTCPEVPGTPHDLTGSGNYCLVYKPMDAPGQEQWRWCAKCQGLWWSGQVSSDDPGDPGNGSCPVGRGHTLAGSGEYVLRHGAVWP